MNRRSLVKSILGCIAAPLACLAKPKMPTIILNVQTDAAGFRAMLPKVQEEIIKAWAEAVRRDTARRACFKTWDEASKYVEDHGKRFKIYNIHNNGYRLLGDPTNKTYYD